MAQVKLVVKQVDEGSKAIAANAKSLNNLLDVAAKTSAAVAGAGVVFKQAFDLSKQGASLNQLTSSFELMNEQVFKVPGLLDKMSAAARGTIAETDLMAGLLTLTAGASDELSQRFAQAAPQLLEIAKASNKLNPSLGDTAFLYESISRGIKRASPLILDNLGIVVKVGDANTRFANELGKAVEQLTAEEKQMALLNEVLRSGGQLIDQVGGNIDSQVDAWARLEVQIASQTDAFKQWLADGLLPVISTLSGDYGTSVDNTIERTVNQTKSLEELIAAGQRMQKVYEDVGKAGLVVTGTTDEFNAGVRETILAIAAASDSTEDLQANLVEAFGEDASTLLQDNIVGIRGVTVGLEEMEAVLGTNTDALKAQIREAAAADVAMLRYGQSVEMTAGQIRAYSLALAEARGPNEELADKTRQAENQMTEYEASVAAAEAASERAAEANELHAEQMEENARAAEEAAEAHAALVAQLEAEEAGFFQTALASQEAGDVQLDTNQAMYDAAAAAGASAEELAILGGALGLYSDEAIEAALKTAAINVKIQELAQAYADGEISVGLMRAELAKFIAGLDETEGAADEAGGAIDKFAGGLSEAEGIAANVGSEIDKLSDKMANLPDSHTFKVDIQTTGSIPTIPGGPGGAPFVPTATALGGFLRADQVSQVGEFNLPELFKQDGRLFLIPGDQGQVFSNSQSQGMMGSTTLNAPITVNVTGGGDPEAISNAVQDALLKSMRMVGVR